MSKLFFPRCFLSGLLVAFLSLALGQNGKAAEAKVAPEFGDSIDWAVKGESPSLANLRGKSVLVVFFQSWCGICNGWSGELFQQAQAAYENDPTIQIVALKTDGGSPQDAIDYLSERTDPTGWLVGVEDGATYYRSVTGHDKLYYYAWITPDGSIGEVIKAGNFQKGKNGKKNFTLALQQSANRYRKGAQAHFPEAGNWGEEEVVAAAEQGRFLTALQLLSKSRTDGAQSLRTAIGEKVGASIQIFSEQVQDAANPNRYPAYMRLNQIAEDFGNSPQGKAARAAADQQKRGSWLRDEEDAHRGYQSIMKRASRADSARDRERIQKSLQKLAEKFPGTYHGRLAGKSGS